MASLWDNSLRQPTAQTMKTKVLNPGCGHRGEKKVGVFSISRSQSTVQRT